MCAIFCGILRGTVLITGQQQAACHSRCSPPPPRFNLPMVACVLLSCSCLPDAASCHTSCNVSVSLCSAACAALLSNSPGQHGQALTRAGFSPAQRRWLTSALLSPPWGTLSQRAPLHPSKKAQASSQPATQASLSNIFACANQEL